MIQRLLYQQPNNPIAIEQEIGALGLFVTDNSVQGVELRCLRQSVDGRWELHDGVQNLGFTVYILSSTRIGARRSLIGAGRWVSPKWDVPRDKSRWRG